MILKAEFGGMFNSVLYVDGVKCDRFPVSRPCTGTDVHVFNQQGEYLGKGFGGDCKQSGGTINVDGRTYDSNHDLWWVKVVA